MNYVRHLSNDQITELMNIYAPHHTDLKYRIEGNHIRISLRDQFGYEDNYIIDDYNVDVIDWMGNEDKYLKQYRQKMLNWFGNQYAINYLLGEY